MLIILFLTLFIIYIHYNRLRTNVKQYFKKNIQLEFDFDADGWWHGSYFFNSGKEISEFWQSELGINLYAKEQAERQKEIDSLINAHICEVSEGMMSLSHVG